MKRALSALVALVSVTGCGGNTRADDEPDSSLEAGPCSLRQSSGNLGIDCERYCSVYSECGQCPASVAKTCQSQCLEQGAYQLACLDCAVAHVHEMVGALTCNDFSPDGVLTITYPISACGAVCQ